MTIELERRYRFSAAHRYYRPEWSEAENAERFGKCAWGSGHGHNYRVTLRIAGNPDPETGFVVDLPALDRLVRERVLEVVDHRHLNEAIAEFASGGRIPSCENLVVWIREQIADGLPPGARLTGVRVAEDDDLSASWRGASESIP
jgi:6-pyruvoyltetrahydropterin/6-carboxytetrahydropterin synthase